MINQTEQCNYSAFAAAAAAAIVIDRYLRKKSIHKFIIEFTLYKRILVTSNSLVIFYMKCEMRGVRLLFRFKWRCSFAAGGLLNLHMSVKRSMTTSDSLIFSLSASLVLEFESLLFAFPVALFSILFVIRKRFCMRQMKIKITNPCAEK